MFVSELIIFFPVYKRLSQGLPNPLVGQQSKMNEATGMLRNTVEQFVWHAVSVLAVTTYYTAEQMKFVGLQCILFAIGRVFFFFGYPTDHRFGLALGWFPAGFAWLYTVYCMYTKGISSF